MNTMNTPPMTGASEQYAQAYSIHYSGRDLLRALQAYGRVIDSHPGAAEAGYARAQLKNIIHVTVPAEELLASQIALALEHLRQDSDDAVVAATH